MQIHAGVTLRWTLRLTASLTLAFGVAACGPSPTIEVLEGTYGANCGARVGNATPRLVAKCNGRTACSYTVNVGELGNPAVGCAKDFIARWRCGRDSTVHTSSVAPEAGLGRVADLRCG